MQLQGYSGWLHLGQRRLRKLALELRMSSNYPDKLREREPFSEQISVVQQTLVILNRFLE